VHRLSRRGRGVATGAHLVAPRQQLRDAGGCVMLALLNGAAEDAGSIGAFQKLLAAQRHRQHRLQSTALQAAWCVTGWCRSGYRGQRTDLV
jgi:hypothetical protein